MKLGRVRVFNGLGDERGDSIPIQSEPIQQESQGIELLARDQTQDHAIDEYAHLNEKKIGELAGRSTQVRVNEDNVDPNQMSPPNQKLAVAGQR